MRDIVTERMILKEYKSEYAQGLYDYAKDPEVGPPAGWAPHKSVEESEEIIKELFIPVEGYAIFDKEDGRLIGTIALEYDRYRPDANSREIGYSLAKDMWGKGLMTEAAAALMKFAFEELKLDQIGICTGPSNKRSQGVIKKCGFTYEGTVRRAYKIYDGSFRDSLLYSILKEEYFEMQK